MVTFYGHHMYLWENRYTWKFFAIIYKAGNFCDFLFIPAHQIPSEKGSTLKVKNVLPFSEGDWCAESK